MTTEPTGSTAADAVTKWEYSATTGLLAQKTLPDGGDDDTFNYGFRYT